MAAIVRCGRVKPFQVHAISPLKMGSEGPIGDRLKTYCWRRPKAAIWRFKFRALATFDRGAQQCGGMQPITNGRFPEVQRIVGQESFTNFAFAAIGAIAVEALKSESHPRFALSESQLWGGPNRA